MTIHLKRTNSSLGETEADQANMRDFLNEVGPQCAIYSTTQTLRARGDHPWVWRQFVADHDFRATTEQMHCANPGCEVVAVVVPPWFLQGRLSDADLLKLQVLGRDGNSCLEGQ